MMASPELPAQLCAGGDLQGAERWPLEGRGLGGRQELPWTVHTSQGPSWTRTRRGAPQTPGQVTGRAAWSNGGPRAEQVPKQRAVLLRVEQRAPPGAEPQGAPMTGLSEDGNPAAGRRDSDGSVQVAAPPRPRAKVAERPAGLHRPQDSGAHGLHYEETGQRALGRTRTARPASQPRPRPHPGERCAGAEQRRRRRCDVTARRRGKQTQVSGNVNSKSGARAVGVTRARRTRIGGERDGRGVARAAMAACWRPEIRASGPPHSPAS